MAQTTVSGVLFENELRKMVSTLVWHNKYLGDKYDKESRFVDPVEVDTYLTGARHLLMSNSQAKLESIETMTEAAYLKEREKMLHSTDDSVRRDVKFWDMFYFGSKCVDLNGNILSTDKLQGVPKYVEKNTYYRELFGLPEYVGKSCHCNNCEYDALNMTKCPRCGSTNIDYNHSAPSMYSYISQFPKYNNKSVQESYYLYDDGGNIIENRENYSYETCHCNACGCESLTMPEKCINPNCGSTDINRHYTVTFDESKPETDETTRRRLDFNPLVFLYERPIQERFYAMYTVSFVNDCIEKTKGDRHYRYLSHMGMTKIHPFVARISDRYEILYLADASIDFLNKDFRKVYDDCRLFMKYRYYTEAFRNQYKEYEGFIGMAIMYMALERMQSKYLEADITRDFYDLESIEVVYNAYSVPFYDDIPITYHNKIIKAINRLLSVKGTNKCFRDIFAIFGYSTLNMYQYYILKTQKRDNDGQLMFAYDNMGNEIPEDMYDVKIVKADIGENPYNYILDSMNYLNYYGVTEPDTYWLNDEDLLYKLYHSEYNFIETKYIGIQMAFSLTRLTIETEYLMRMLLDNRFEGTSDLSIMHSRIGREIPVYDLVIYIMYTIGTELGLQDGGSLALLSDPAKLGAIYGFNFLEDFTEVYGYLSRKFIYNYKAGIVEETPGRMATKINNETVYVDVMSKVFRPTDYSSIDIMQLLPNDDPNIINMDKEFALNDLAHSDISSFFNGFKTYLGKYLPHDEDDEDEKIDPKYQVTISPNGLERHLVYTFNTLRKLLTTYTSDEMQLKDILSEKFTTEYWSPEVCAYCGMPKMAEEQYTFCHNIGCVSNHNYGTDTNPDYGPKLVDEFGNIPDSQEIDTSKDTLDTLIRNRIYADFIHKFTDVNPLMLNLLEKFNPITSVSIEYDGYEDTVGTISYDTFDFNDTATAPIIYYESNSRNIYINDLYWYAFVANVKAGNPVTVTYTDTDDNSYTIEAYVLYLDTDPVVIHIGDDDVNFIKVVLDREINIPENTTSVSVSIKYRNIEISFDEWHSMMMAGLTAWFYMNSAYKKYEEIKAARIEDPTSYTEFEEYDMFNRYCVGKYVYENSLYFVLNLLAYYVESEDDIDLSTIYWYDLYYDYLPTYAEGVTNGMKLLVMPDPSLFYDETNNIGYYVDYYGDNVYDGDTLVYEHDYRYECVRTLDAETGDYVYEWIRISLEPIPEIHTNQTIESKLKSLNMYIALIGLRSKYEFRLFISNQISELTPIVSEPNNGDSDEIPASVNDYEYVPPYYDRLNEVNLAHYYLAYYFLDNKDYIDDTDKKSQLVNVIDNYYLNDYLHYESDYKYGGIDEVKTDTSISYMNETMYNIRSDGKGIKLFDYVKTHIRDILDQDDSINNRHELNIGIGKPADDFDKLKSSYASISDLYDAFIEVAWNAKDPRTFYAMRRLQKMLMTTRYAKEIYTLKNDENTVAESYRQLLDSIDPTLTSRIDNMTDTQRIAELEYSLECLSKCADDLIYIHAYGGFNMKKIISYIFKLLIFFKSAKADLLDYALEFHIDDKTDNMVKYMAELTKVTSNTIMTPDHWRMTDYIAKSEALIRLNIDKSDRLTFTDEDLIFLLMRTVSPQSPLYLMDSIALHKCKAKILNEINYNLYDFLKHSSSTTTIDSRNDVRRAFAYYIHIKAVRENDEYDTIYNQYDEDMAYLKYLDVLRMYNENMENDRNIRFGDDLTMTKRVIYKLDYTAEPTIDEYNNSIYPPKLDEYNQPVKEVIIDQHIQS